MLGVGDNWMKDQTTVDLGNGKEVMKDPGSILIPWGIGFGRVGRQGCHGSWDKVKKKSGSGEVRVGSSGLYGPGQNRATFIYLFFFSAAQYRPLLFLLYIVF